MSHPYSGAASYIYANEYLSEDNLPIPRSYYHRQTEWIPVPLTPFSPPPPVINEPIAPPRSPLPRFMSVPNFSSRLKRGKSFSASSAVTVAPVPSIAISSVAPSQTYQSMRVRFDTPDPYVVTWRRQMKAVKRRMHRFKARLSEFLIPSWITTPHPRLSMAG